MESENLVQLQQHCIKIAENMPRRLQQLVEETEWEKLSVTKTGYTFHTLRNSPSSKGRQTVLVTGVLPSGVDKVMTPLFEELELASLWSPRVKSVKIVRKIDSCTLLSHQVSKGVAGLISERDFVVLRRKVLIKDASDILQSSILAMQSVTLPEYPESSRIVRGETGLSGWLFSANDNELTNFHCVVDLDPKLKVWLPNKIYENRFVSEVTQSIDALKERLSKLNN